MQSNVGRVALGAVALIAAVVLLIVLKGDDEGGDGDGGTPAARVGDTKSAGRQADDFGEPSLPLIVVRNGKAVGGIAELSFEAGDRIRFQVRSNRADELHVHGYDVEEELPAGRPVRVEFPATIEGVFEAELHGSGEQVAELRIEP